MKLTATGLEPTLKRVRDMTRTYSSSTSNGKFMILSKCGIFNIKKSKCIKKQKAKGLLSKLGIKTPFSKLPILGDILF